jgi:hypothetical protein
VRRGDIATALTGACLAASVLSAGSGAAAEERVVGGTLTLEASRLILSPDGDAVTAEGEVRLATRGFELAGEQAVVSLPDGTIRLSAPFTLALPEIRLEAASGELSREGRSLHLTRPRAIRSAPPPAFEIQGERLDCDDGLCVLTQGSGTACPHTPAGYRLAARRITLHPSGDVDLTSPTLILGDTTVAWLPWLRLRPPTKPGFLPPRIGYTPSAGLIAGPAGHLPLGDRAHVDGHVAVRTAQGLEDVTHLLAPGVDLRVEHVLDAPDNFGRARLGLETPLSGATAAVGADLVTDRRAIEETTFAPLDRAMTHTSSRALVSMPMTHVLLESSFAGDQTLRGVASDGWPALQTIAAVRGTLLAIPNRTRIWPAVDLALERRDASRRALFYDAVGGPAESHTRLTAQPSVSAPLRLGPITMDLRAGSRHAVWLVDGEDGNAPFSHSVGGSARLALPLVGRLAGRPHLIAPRVEYRAVPWISASLPQWVFDPVERPRRAHAVEAAVETVLDPFAEAPLLRAELAQRVGLPGLGADGPREYLYGKLRLDALWLELRGEIAWDQEVSAVSAAAAGVGARDGRGNGIAVDARWYGPGVGPHTDGRWTAGDGAWIGDAPWIAEPQERLEIAPEGTAVLARVVTLEGGARVEIAPRPGLNALWYGVGVRSSCGCAEIGLKAAHRLDTPVPDVMLTVTLE